MKIGENLEVTGGIKIGNDLEPCIAAKVGTLKYTASKFFYCNSTSWKELVPVPTTLPPAPTNCGAITSGNACRSTTGPSCRSYTCINGILYGPEIPLNSMEVANCNALPSCT